MALYNGLVAADYQRRCNFIANDIAKFCNRAKEWSERMSACPDADLTALGLSADMVTNIRSMQGEIDALVAFWQAKDGNGAYTASVFTKRFEDPIPT